MNTPLLAEHHRLNAKMTVFGGWEMPLYYSSIVREVLAVRSHVGIFDLSHMGEIYISGPRALDLIQYLCTNDASRLNVGEAQYSLLCNETGGVLDDLIVYRTADDVYLLVVNASNAEADFKWITDHNQIDAVVDDRSASTALIAVQGPKSAQLLKHISGIDLTGMKRFHIAAHDVAGIDCLVASTGYTGGDGYELYFRAEDAPALWNKLMEAAPSFEAEPIGLGARDVLRIEAGYPLYGQELTTATTPVEAKLMWVVKLAKPDFIGRETIARRVEARPGNVLVGFEAIDRCIPRHEYSLVANGAVVGTVTSGTFSPTLQKGIGMAYIQSDFSSEGTEFAIMVREKPCRCKIVRLPFYRP
jgi:aminomethyltransferase